MTWRPLSKRHTAQGRESYDALHDCIPEWLRSTLLDWIREAVLAIGGYRGRDHVVLFLQHIERRLRVTLKFAQRNRFESPGDRGLEELQLLAIKDPEFGVDLIDCLLTEMKAGDIARREIRAAALEGFLAGGGSAWCVNDDFDALERRVSHEVARRAREVMSSKTRVVEHLRDAWSAAYGRHRNPGHSYGESIKAVEAAAIPIVSPKNSKATLGTLILDLRATPSKWTTSLTPTGKSAIDLATGMLELLWKGQLDRHGTPDPKAPFAATQEEAEAAVHLALTLVHWFETGGVWRK